MNVLITRPQEDAAPLAETLMRLGIESLVEPMLTIRFIDGDFDLDGVQALLMTSANGVRAFAARTESRNFSVYAVGDATQRTARAAGFETVETASGDVEALANLVGERLDPTGGALLHPAGSRLAGDLGGRLEAKGYSYRRAVLYQAEPATALSDRSLAALSSGAIDGVLLYSPRTARAFVELARPHSLGDARAFCLSPAVAEAAAALPWRSIETAARPEQAALIELLRQFN